MEIIPFTDANDFIDYFKPYSPQWKEDDSVFRGHLDSSWELIPTLFRKSVPGSDLEKIINLFDDQFPYQFPHKSTKIQFMSLRNDPAVSALRMYNFERYLLHLFVKESNRHGFEVHGSEHLLNLDNVFDSHPRDAFYNPEVSEEINAQSKITMPEPPPLLTGLAQHHGLPTRLLDFTESPYAALYFASLPTKNEENEEICVFSTSLRFYRKGAHILHSAQIDPYAPKICEEKLAGLYESLRMPNSHNNFMSKQGGIFLYPVHPFIFQAKHHRYPNLDDHAKNFLDRDGKECILVKKHTLPGSQKPALRKALTKLKYTKAYFMPTMDNVVGDIKNYLQKQ